MNLYLGKKVPELIEITLILFCNFLYFFEMKDILIVDI